METTLKLYRDSEEIDRAWNEMMEAIKPLNVKRFKPTYILPGSDESKDQNRKKRLHHPALITPADLHNWELFG